MIHQTVLDYVLDTYSEEQRPHIANALFVLTSIYNEYDCNDLLGIIENVFSDSSGKRESFEKKVLTDLIEPLRLHGIEIEEEVTLLQGAALCNVLAESNYGESLPIVYDFLDEQDPQLSIANIAGYFSDTVDENELITVIGEVDVEFIKRSKQYISDRQNGEPVDRLSSTISRLTTFTDIYTDNLASRYLNSDGRIGGLPSYYLSLYETVLKEGDVFTKLTPLYIAINLVALHLLGGQSLTLSKKNAADIASKWYKNSAMAIDVPKAIRSLQE